MATKAPRIFVKNEAFRDAHHDKTADTLLTGLEGLISIGEPVATGEDSIEQVFDSAQALREWFDKTVNQASDQ